MTTFFILQQKVRCSKILKILLKFIFQRTKPIEKTPNKATLIKTSFKNGDPISINGKKLKRKLLEKLNQIGGKNGVGRVDLVENNSLE